MRRRPALRFAPCGLRIAQAASFSRGNILRGLPIPSPHRTREASADRRPGAAAPVVYGRAPHEARARPRADSSRRPRSRGTLASRRSTAAVFWPRAHLSDAFGRCLSRRCPICLAMLHSQVPLVVAGGRCRSGASRGTWSRASPQDAASRSDSGSSPETPSVSGTPRR